MTNKRTSNKTTKTEKKKQCNFSKKKQQFKYYKLY